jgi:SAM-dependent methyltransferase
MNRNKVDILKRKLKTFLKDIYYLLLDLKDTLFGKRDELTPPRRLIFIGDGDFRKIGNEFFRYFVELGGLQPEHKVLDVGCGIGRMAIPLTKFLTRGSYSGFDIVPRGINWSNKVISKRYPNFHFQLADVYNKGYNPAGKYEASEYRFPFESETFDYIYLTSVFTHMLPSDLENYFSEITRVLKKDGKTFITYFLLNNDSRELMTQNLGKLDFNHAGEGFWTVSKSKPESAVAYDEQYVKNLYMNSQLQIVSPIHYGSWCGRKEYLSYQDIIVAEKG